ncbi:Polyprenol-phosphate-mannose-dependent alpha-(1-2)-phosphatidylinositol mannoside mannosyltransferase [Corynebacterium atrinae]|nr:Polyprenol-phosphate-mannose-dependent alpha-(1-2)-phosphatidylinositol mannoside mannosyltransferase [Corynebacterium atrinae]
MGAILALIVILFFLLVRPGPTWMYHVDTDVYRSGAAAFLAGDNLYTRSYEVDSGALPFTYPPLAAILFVPLTWLSLDFSALALTAATVAALWWCLTIVLRHCFPEYPGRNRRLLALWLLPLALLMEPIRSTIDFGQINVVLMALVISDLLGRRGPVPRGVLVGLAAAIKLTPAVFGLVFLVRRQWKEALTSIAAGLGFSLFAAVISPHNSWTYWTSTLFHTDRIGDLGYAKNQSIQGLLTRLGVPHTAEGSLLWVGLVAATLLLIVGGMMRVHRLPGGELGVVLLASLAALLCSPVSWSHHWTWLVPFAVLFAAVGLYRSGRWILMAGCIAAIGVIGPGWAPLGNSYVAMGCVLAVLAVTQPRAFVPRGRR